MPPARTGVRAGSALLLKWASSALALLIKLSEKPFASGNAKTKPNDFASRLLLPRDSLIFNRGNWEVWRNARDLPYGEARFRRHPCGLDGWVYDISFLLH